MSLGSNDTKKRAPGVPLFAGVMGLWLAGCILTQAADRLKLNFNGDWRFLKADPTGASQPAFDDSAWNHVSAPHTFNDTDTFDDWSPPSHIGETNQWSGRTWYRKLFVLPEAYRGKKVFLEFEAVRQVAEVYLNGQPLGTNWTGFIPFGFDLTPHLRFGGVTNVLAVMADNRFTLDIDLASIAATELPWNSPHWHPAHGGIYRNVYLHVTDPVHITLPLYNSLQTVGPYFYATGISTTSATVHCELPIRNESRATVALTARMELLHWTGQLVLSREQDLDLPAGALKTVSLAGAVSTPKLWEPAYPYLYTTRCSLLEKGRKIDSLENLFGIRQVHFDAKTGFSINGHRLKLRGWGQRPTSEWPGLGAAQPDWMHFYTLELMKEAGGNFVRWGHCAGAPADIIAADLLGILVLQPGVDGEGDASGNAWRLRADAFRDMLVYYRNHPSIIIWEGGNQKVTREHAQELRSYVDQFDPHGGRAYAHRRADEITGEFMDVDIGTEGGRQVPRLPVVEGEYDREESPRRVWDNFSPPNFGYPEAKGQTYQLTSEEFAVNEVGQYVSKLGRPYHCGGGNWVFSDTTSGGRVGCEVARASGEVDGVRLPKEAYYALRSMWRNDPQVHVIGHWNYPAGTRKTVYVVSNCPEVELFLNGKSLGRGKRSDRYLFTFPDVTWARGEIKAVACRDGKPAATESKRTTGEPVSLRLTRITGPKGFLADGSDVALIDVEAVDNNGQRCPTVQQRVDFEIAGPAGWRGGYNSGKTNSINHLFLDLECGINRVAVRSTPVAGIITLGARSSGLRPAEISLESKAVPAENGCSTALPVMTRAPVLERPVYEDQLILAETGSDVEVGRFLKAFSYSGPASVQVKQDPKNGAAIYADRDTVFQGLPEPLQGSDWVQTANADRLYSAVDLMDLAVRFDSTVYVAHDDRLPRPAWLQSQFQASELSLSVNSQAMKIFARRLRPGETVTLGSNTEDRRLKSCNMYVVFVKPATPSPQGKRTAGRS